MIKLLPAATCAKSQYRYSSSPGTATLTLPNYHYYKLNKSELPFHARKAYVGVEVWLHSFLTSALDGMSGQLHTPAALAPEKGARVPTNN